MLHHWGDYDDHLDSVRLREYIDDARIIEMRIRQLVQLGNDVRLLESKQGPLNHISIYRRARISKEEPYHVEPRISIISSGRPEDLLAQEFHFVFNANDDATIEKIIEKKTEGIDKTHVQFMTQYWLAGRILLEQGLPIYAVNPDLYKLSDRIMDLRKRGNEARLVRGTYNDETSMLEPPTQDNNCYALFARFDIGLFLAPPDEHPDERVVEQGYHFDGEFPFTAWGDTLARVAPSDRMRVQTENKDIEEYIMKMLSRGTRVRLFWGKFDQQTRSLDRSAGCVSCFKR